MSKAPPPKSLPPLPTAGGSYVLNKAGDGWEPDAQPDPTPEPTAPAPKPLPPLPTAGGSYVLNKAGDGWEHNTSPEPSTTTPDPDEELSNAAHV